MRTNKRCSRSILTINGKIEFSRYVLRPKTKDDSAALIDTEGISAVVPMDCYLGITELPFKMTAEAMLEVAFWAQNQASYQTAEEAVFKSVGIRVNDDTVRLIANHIGSMVFERDCELAEAAYDKLVSGKLSFPERKKSGVLYIEADGAALNTREKDNDGSTWRENKLGVVFSSDNIHFWTDKKGVRQHRIEKREYVSYVGSAEEFKKHLFACAVQNGYGAYGKTVILSDGATWIRNMKEELFPDAQQILDYYHLCENVNDFAKQIFNMDESIYRPWADRICKELKNSRLLLKGSESRAGRNISEQDGNTGESGGNPAIDIAVLSAQGFCITAHCGINGSAAGRTETAGDLGLAFDPSESSFRQKSKHLDFWRNPHH